MDRLIDAALDRYRTVLMVLGFILVMGTLAYVSVPKEAAPDVRVPIIYVSMELEGIAPEDAERLLLRPMEKKLQSIESVKEMTSEATEGFASVVLEFEAGFNAEKALADVRAKVDEAKPELPEDTEEPEVREVNFSMFPVVTVILSGDVQQRTLLRLARDLRDKIEGISSVLEARIDGDREEVLEIIIDPLTLESYNIAPQDVLQRVEMNNVLVAAGEMDTGSGRYKIQVPGLIETLSDLQNVALINDGDTVVTLSDIAEIRRSFKDVETHARVGGKSAVGLAVSKRTGANIIDTVEAVRALVRAEQEQWPQGIRVFFAQDNSDRIRSMLSDLENNVILAILLVMAIIMLTLGSRTAGMVAFAVPGAFLIGILCIALLGYTMNIVVLFSLILSVGLLVDSAIIVTEYSDKLAHQKVPLRQAYPAAAKRMAWPIIASTLTTLVVFMPLLYWPGIVGQFMSYMPITLILTLTGSLLMALIFLPVIGVWLARAKLPLRGGVEEARPEAEADSVGVFSPSPVNANAFPTPPLKGGVKEGAFFPRLTGRYAEILERVLSRPWRFVIGLITCVAVMIAVFVSVGPGVEFFPKIEPKNANLLVRARGNLSVGQMDDLVRQVEERLATMKDEVQLFFARSGKVSLREMPEDTIGVIQMEFVDWRQRRKADVILADMVRHTQDIPGIIVESAKQQEGPPTGKPVQLEFRSRFPELLVPAVTTFVEEGLPSIGGFMNIEDERPVPRIEWEFEVNREVAGRNNISMVDIGNVVKFVSNGIKINEYRPDDADDEIDIVVRFPPQYRNLGQLEQLRVHTPGGLEPITNFITRVPKQSVGTIRRVDGARVLNVRADVLPGIQADAKVQAIRAWLERSGIDPQVEIRFRGEDEEQKEAGAFLSLAFGIALFLMALILTTQFNSVYRMVVIMSAVFLSTGGVLLGLLLGWQPFGIVMCGVGVIALAGVVVNNNIIFIDTYQLFRAEGVPVREALILTGEDRLRPILLTAGTTVLGLLPMVVGMNLDFVGRSLTFGAPSTQWWIQLSTAIAGGLTFATILTLFFTPCLLLLYEQRQER